MMFTRTIDADAARCFHAKREQDSEPGFLTSQIAAGCVRRQAVAEVFVHRWRACPNWKRSLAAIPLRLRIQIARGASQAGSCAEMDGQGERGHAQPRHRWSGWTRPGSRRADGQDCPNRNRRACPRRSAHSGRNQPPAGGSVARRPESSELAARLKQRSMDDLLGFAVEQLASAGKYFDLLLRDGGYTEEIQQDQLVEAGT